MRSTLRRISRRRFLLSAVAALPAGALLDACLETFWLKTRELSLSNGLASHRIVHFTDLHYRGGRKTLANVVARINDLAPDLVCFTGDLIEHAEHLHGVLKILRKINRPMYGVPGNHDYWAKISFEGVRECFASTGGAWLMDQQVHSADSRIVITGASCLKSRTPIPDPVPDRKNILLIHYPAWLRQVRQRFDILLAGHSHGGQVRIPFYGAIITPFLTEGYEVGLFDTPAGPMYVNPGIGWFAVPLRFNCRPEVTVIHI